MSALSPILRRVEGGFVAFWCPGCDQAHMIRVDAPDQPCWSWDLSVDKPSFSPSILVRGTEPLTDAEAAQVMRGDRIYKPATVCHSYVTGGQIQFLPDCTHRLAGQVMPLPNWPRNLVH